VGDLTAHFSLREFQSKDGARMPDAVRANVAKTAAMLERLRAALSADLGLDCPLTVTSGYRSPVHNAKVGGVPNSLHLNGMAADVTCTVVGPRAVQKVAKRLQEAGIIGGVGCYAGFTHVDTGPKRTWTQATKSTRGGADGTG
jgi:uncharacterized protein YcbK (DUF882 family)